MGYQSHVLVSEGAVYARILNITAENWTVASTYFGVMQEPVRLHVYVAARVAGC